jgi:anti-sigma regulatory factor (Ser/Thr protein kinase)
VHLDLKTEPGEVGRARQLVGRFLADSPEDVRTVAQLLTSELVTNAVHYSSGEIKLSLDCADHVLRVRVRDESSHHPQLRRPQTGDERGGRGLLFVESLALSWGVAPDRTSGGKTVWFRLRTG